MVESTEVGETFDVDEPHAARLPQPERRFEPFERLVGDPRLAMRGAPARAIKDLAGHADLSTTLNYMHLSPGALDQAIHLLDSPATPTQAFGEILEKGRAEEKS